MYVGGTATSWVAQLTLEGSLHHMMLSVALVGRVITMSPGDPSDGLLMLNYDTL